MNGYTFSMWQANRRVGAPAGVVLGAAVVKGACEVTEGVAVSTQHGRERVGRELVEPHKMTHMTSALECTPARLCEMSSAYMTDRGVLEALKATYSSGVGRNSACGRLSCDRGDCK